MSLVMVRHANHILIKQILLYVILDLEHIKDVHPAIEHLFVRVRALQPVFSSPRLQTG